MMETETKLGEEIQTDSLIQHLGGALEKNGNVSPKNPSRSCTNGELSEQDSEMLMRVLVLDSRERPHHFNLKEAGISKNLATTLKVLRLADELLKNVFPRIENHLYSERESKFRWDESVRGPIQWAPTILNAVKGGYEVPVRFLCRVERTDFSTPENILALYVMLLLQYDTERLLNNTSMERLLEGDDLVRLKKIWRHIDSTLQHTILRPLVPIVEQYVSFADPQFIKEKEGDTRTRIRQRIVRQRSYVSLIDWLEKYRRYHLYADSGTVSFREVDKTPSTIYEYWIFYEIAYYLEKEGFNVKKESSGTKLSFQISSGSSKFKLRYQDLVKGQWGESKSIQSKPDFTIGPVGGPDESAPRSIILDAKHHVKTEDESQQIHKMLGYLMNLAERGARIGVLFFLREKRSTAAEENGGNPTQTETQQSRDEKQMSDWSEDNNVADDTITEYTRKDGKKEFKLAVMRHMSMRERKKRDKILTKVIEYIKEI